MPKDTKLFVKLNPSEGTVTLICSNPQCGCEFTKPIGDYKKAINRGQSSFYHQKNCYLRCSTFYLGGAV